MIILCWNRDSGKGFTADMFELCRLDSENGRIVKGSWSVGNHINIEKKSECYLLVVGEKHPRGIVARGYTTSNPEPDYHWDGSGRITNFVNINWQSLRSFMDPIPPRLLHKKVPNVPWLTGIQGSGFPIKGDNQKRLRDLWESTL